MSSKPAIVGGDPMFPDPIPFARPSLEEPAKILSMIESSLKTGLLTDGPLVRNLEERIEDMFEVRNCVAVASCTTGLILVLQALGTGKSVALPSFTFSATAHAARWNRMQISFTDCEPDAWVLGPKHVIGSPEVIIGVHISGVPCDVRALETMAAELGAALVFDAAHGAGSMIEDGGRMRPLGSFGAAEVFSLTPTKVLNGAEGGLITTNDDTLAEDLRRSRNYGNPGSYDTLEPGLNGRLSELHASVALSGLDHLADRVARRNALAAHYRALLGALPGIRFQDVPSGRLSSVKDFTIVVSEEFGVERHRVVEALTAEGIPTRPYYSPPVHRQTAYRDVVTPELPVTDALASGVISLPMWSHMETETVDRIAWSVERIRSHRDLLGGSLAK